MRVRHIISESKIITTDTNWSDKDLQPKHAPIFSKTKPTKAGWKWRSAKIESDLSKFILFAECNPAFDNWKSVLMIETNEGHSVAARFEHHGSHPGLHVHSHCERSGIETSTTSMDNLLRLPPVERFHRRTNSWTERGFWEASKSFFNIQDQAGVLGL